MDESKLDNTSATTNPPKKIKVKWIISFAGLLLALLGIPGIFFAVKTYGIDSSNDYKIYLHVKSPDFHYFTIFIN